MASIQASSLSVGTSVYLKYNGNYEEFLVIHQGNPNSSIYDSSCDGTWLLKRNCVGTSESAYQYSSNSYNYSTSYMHTQYLNNFFNALGNQEQNIIKQVKIPYYQDDNIFLGSNGLSTSLFLLSVTEIFGNVSNDYAAIPDFGSQLKFFENNVYTFILQDSNGVQITSGGSWTRTPQLTTNKNYVSAYGNLIPGLFLGSLICTSGGFYQPAMIISSDTLFDSSTMKLFIDDSNTSSSTSYKVGDVLNYEYTGSVQTVTLPAGTYKLECWGAQGGYRNNSSYGGKGGYSYGTITLQQNTKLFIYAGGFPGNTNSSAGTNTTRAGGFNGGGKRHGYYGGGGGSDIRIGQDSLYARVIVAGGGGSDGATSKTGMYGGGSSGGSSTQNFGTGGGGGTQTAGGAGGSNNSGSFGQGGQGLYRSNGYAGAGGGGWYGGGGSSPDGSGDDDRGGGGGSGYVYTSSTASQYPSGCLLNASYYLTDANTIAGNSSFTDYSGSQVIGHSGHGVCRITILKLKKASPIIKLNSSTWNENTEMFVKIDSNTWASVDAIYIKTENGWKEGG